MLTIACLHLYLVYLLVRLHSVLEVLLPQRQKKIYDPGFLELVTNRRYVGKHAKAFLLKRDKH